MWKKGDVDELVDLLKIDRLNQTATYNYDNAGKLTSLTNFNGTVTTYGYDNANRLMALDNKKSDTTTILASYSFTLDSNGNRTQTMQNEPLTLTPSTDTVSYGYNAKKNRLMTANTTNFIYDDEGQLLWSKDGADTYMFDEAHRLTYISDGSYYAEFFYDGAGNRLRANRDWIETRYIYDAQGNLLAEADNLNNITRYYIHGLGLMAMVTPTGEVYTYHFNAVGSTIAMTDSGQNVVNKYSYDEFGKIMNQVENVPQPFKFVGQYGVMTEPNGFYYMRARYYDPEIGRFISEDPIGFDGGDVNLMVYVGNNPLLLIDPLGLRETGALNALESEQPMLLAGNEYNPYKGTGLRPANEGDPMRKILPKNYKTDGINNLPGQKIPPSPSTPKWKIILNSIFQILKGVTRPSVIIVPDPRLYQPPLCENGDLCA